MVSIHAPVMGAKSHAKTSRLLASFNPRTRDGCERRRLALLTGIQVSIHAPVMGANIGGLGGLMSDKVSIHAPVMGAK